MRLDVDLTFRASNFLMSRMTQPFQSRLKDKYYTLCLMDRDTREHPATDDVCVGGVEWPRQFSTRPEGI